MIPILYDRFIGTSGVALGGNGIARLTDCRECTVTETTDNEYDCQFVYPADGIGADKLDNGMVVFCTHDAAGDGQPFRIYRRELNLDGTRTYYAHHISYDLRYVVTARVDVPVNTTVGAIFAGLLEYATGNRALFTFTADEPNEVVTGFIIDRPTTIRDILIGSTGSILSKLGHGEFEWDGYNVIFHNGPAGRGSDKGAAIRYGGNLTEGLRQYDSDSGYDWVAPYWIDPDTGVVTRYIYGGATRSADLIVSPGGLDPDGTLPGGFRNRVRPLDISDAFPTEPTWAEAEEYCRTWGAENTPYDSFDSLTVDFMAADAGDSSNPALANALLCDTVHVYVSPLSDREIVAKIVKTIYNPLLDRYDRLEIGQPEVTLSDIYGSGGLTTIQPALHDNGFGVAVGMESTANQESKKFEVANDVTSFFYGPVRMATEDISDLYSFVRTAGACRVTEIRAARVGNMVNLAMAVVYTGTTSSGNIMTGVLSGGPLPAVDTITLGSYWQASGAALYLKPNGELIVRAIGGSFGQNNITGTFTISYLTND